ncbi:PREDICTED: uncharacterized protein LOC105460750, partial [Wasmannia auropunctata]|uniref:uncharacterized protein LOC105460750 n=1 Tax=Wasmannia auropunctata TaxID=64793 RepID=UPI0005EE3D45
MTTDRQDVIDYTIPLVRARYYLYFKEPNVPMQWNLYLKAFSFDVWVTLVIIIIAASFLLTIMKTKNGYFSMDLMLENYIKVWGIYCQQGLP